MLPKQLRLPLRRDQQPFLGFQRIATPFFRLYIQSSSRVQMAIIVPKKQIGKATDRNSIKRRFKAALFELAPQLKKNKIIIVVTHSALTLSVSEIKQQLLKHL